MTKCDNSSCANNRATEEKVLFCSLEDLELVKTWDGSEKNWRLLCLNTTDITYRHKDYVEVNK